MSDPFVNPVVDCSEINILLAEIVSRETTDLLAHEDSLKDRPAFSECAGRVSRLDKSIDGMGRVGIGGSEEGSRETDSIASACVGGGFFPHCGREKGSSFVEETLNNLAKTEKSSTKRDQRDSREKGRRLTRVGEQKP